MKILLIDDNKDITELLSKYLRLSNHECHTSNDARNGLNMIENQHYDAVLLDLAMPNFSGIDVINALVEKNTIHNQKIIIFTASSKPNNDFTELIKMGVHSCLTKPIDPDELVSYIENIEIKNS
ncbi:response regulator [Nitrosarchaeum sp.]|uniref:response regulator n=1 Tax=Nitrosarchaeum sp. TaxID=2026886 RepID=UPI00247D84F4|nr:response regulator [Nitrosarchaeum sp.]MCV0413216.1 response regulator [Nitrosarchaeum sp.]